MYPPSSNSFVCNDTSLLMKHVLQLVLRNVEGFTLSGLPSTNDTTAVGLQRFWLCLPLIAREQTQMAKQMHPSLTFYAVTHLHNRNKTRTEEWWEKAIQQPIKAGHCSTCYRLSAALFQRLFWFPHWPPLYSPLFIIYRYPSPPTRHLGSTLIPFLHYGVGHSHIGGYDELSPVTMLLFHWSPLWILGELTQTRKKTGK